MSGPPSPDYGTQGKQASVQQCSIFIKTAEQCYHGYRGCQGGLEPGLGNVTAINYRLGCWAVNWPGQGHWLGHCPNWVDSSYSSHNIHIHPFYFHDYFQIMIYIAWVHELNYDTWSHAKAWQMPMVGSAIGKGLIFKIPSLTRHQSRGIVHSRS